MAQTYPALTPQKFSGCALRIEACLKTGRVRILGLQSTVTNFTGLVLFGPSGVFNETGRIRLSNYACKFKTSSH